MLFVDGLSGQTHPTFVKAARDGGAIVHVGVAGCTDLLQPIDRGLGKMIKGEIDSQINDWLLDADNHRRWTAPPKEGGITAGELRVLVTHWAAAAWALVSKKSATIVKCAEQSGALIGVGGYGIEKFKLPRRGADDGATTLDVDFERDVGDDFVDKSDDNDNDDSNSDSDSDDADVAAHSSKKRNNNNDDDDDNDSGSCDGDDDGDDADADDDDDELTDVDSDDDDDADEGPPALIAPLGYALVELPRDMAFSLDSKLVGKDILYRSGERVAPRRALIARVAHGKDKATDGKINYVLRFDDGDTAPVWLRNRDYGKDWVMMEKSVAGEQPLKSHEPAAANVVVVTRGGDDDDDDGSSNNSVVDAAAAAQLRAARAQRRAGAAAASTRITNATSVTVLNGDNNVVNINVNGDASTATVQTRGGVGCGASCACVGVSSSSSTSRCSCRRCGARCGCRVSGSVCKNDVDDEDAGANAKRARKQK